MMEHLSGSDIQVVLSLKGGKGFHRIANPTCIVVTLNGQSLETGCIEPDPQPRYATDLVWKTDKNLLRKMRSSQEPLKIECFEMKENGTRDKIGHILLSLRSARIILPRDGDVVVRPNWHKFFNLRNDMKAHKPELLLALTIEEHQAYLQRISRIESEENCNAAQEDFPSELSKEMTSPYLVEEERLIQLGPLATCRRLFLLDIIAGTVKNLHLLKGETEETAGDYSLWYRVMENDVRLKSFGTLDKRLPLDEKATIRIRSSLTMLRNYLRDRPNFFLIMQQRETIIAHSEIDLGPLIPPEMTEDSLRNGASIDTVMNYRCVLKKERIAPILRGNVGDSEDNETFLDLQLRLVHEAGRNFEKSRIIDPSELRHTTEQMQRNIRSVDAIQEVFSEIDEHRNPCGDFGKCINRDYGIIGFNGGQSERDNRQIASDRVPQPRSIVTASNSYNCRSKSVEAYHCYCLNVILNGIRLSTSMHDVEFRFHHPKAEIMSTLNPKMPLSANEKLRLQDIGCKLHFISSSHEIRHLLSSFPPRVSVCDPSDETRICSAKTVLDVDRLFASDKSESQYEAPLYNDDENEIGTMDVALYLEDHGPYYKTHRRAKDENLGPPIMDDTLAYKIVEELEIWKERQQELFLLELKRKEERHLDRLSEEWQQRRENLESKLACSVEQCKILANSLNMATEDLRTRRLKSLEKEARLIKANEDLQWTYDNKLQELREASRRMQEELSSEVNSLQMQIDRLQEEKSRVEAEIEPLRSEKEKLERLTRKQAEEIQACRKGSLTQDQTASLIQDVKTLEQKLANTQKSKSFFKEQWGKAVREIHRMKIEHQQALEVQIKTSRDELKNLDLEEILRADSSSLTNDQIMLGAIQKEIDVIKPARSAYVHADTCASNRSFIATVETIQSQRESKSNRNTGKSENEDERLRKLIEERDSLLKTGSYSIDDAIIVKLNAEIRSLLISN